MRAPGHLRCGASDQLAMPDSRVRERVFGEGGPCGTQENGYIYMRNRFTYL